MRVRNEQIFLLTWTAGCSDAISYLGLGHVFTANMTGNTVLLGLDIEQGEVLAVLRSAVALGGFCLGAFIGAFLVERDQEGATWTPRVTVAIAIEAVLLAAFAAIWLLTGANPPAGGIVNALIALSALAMGLQSALVRSLGIAGIATTYITGTLTNLMAVGARWTRTSVRARKKGDTGTHANEPQKQAGNTMGVKSHLLLSLGTHSKQASDGRHLPVTCLSEWLICIFSCRVVPLPHLA